MARTAARQERQGQELSRARILAAALQVVDRDGLKGLTMRRLAEELKVDPMSIYHYIDDKEALLDGLAEALWSEVQLPDEEMAWTEALRALATSLRELAQAHPHAYGLLCGRGILPGPGLQAIGAGLEALERAGLSRGRAAEMLRTLVAYAVGYAMLELSAAPAGCATGLEQIVQLTRALPPDAPVHLIEVARLMADCDMDYQFHLGLDLILAGLETRLT